MGLRFSILPLLVLFRFLLLPVFVPVPPAPAKGNGGGQQSIRIHKRRADGTYSAHSFSLAAIQEESAAEDCVSRHRHQASSKIAEILPALKNLLCTQVFHRLNFPLFLLLRSIRI